MTDATTPTGMRQALDDIPAVDHHAHLLRRDDGVFALGDDAAPFAEMVLESNDPERARTYIRDHPSYFRAVRDLATLLGTDPDEHSVDAARRSAGHAAYTRRLFDAARLEVMYVDDGLRRDDLLSLHQQQELTGVGVRRVARIEGIVEESAATWPSFGDLRDRVRAELTAAVSRGLVGLKTIAAFRCGLELPRPDEEAARRGYDAWRRSDSRRLVDASVIAFFIAEALEVTRGDPLPLQVHTGLVGTQTSLRSGDPALLRQWLNDTVPPSVPVVLLHCYPFLREASWLAGLYPNVYLDLSMAMQWVVHRGSDLVLEAVDVAPFSKLLFSTDGFRVPELFYLGAKWWRDSLAEALSILVARGQADEATARRYATMVLSGNSHRLYGTDVPR